MYNICGEIRLSGGVANSDKHRTCGLCNTASFFFVHIVRNDDEHSARSPHQWLPQSFQSTLLSPRPPYSPCPSQSPMFWPAFKTRTGAMRRRASTYQILCTLSYVVWCFQEDQECPLCLEEMDVSDLNFKPCVCGYQVRSS